MRLLSLLENDTIWYHGTPDGQKFRGAFEQRNLSVSYISDYEGWKDTMERINTAERGSDEYFKLIDMVLRYKAHKNVRSPIFFSNNRSVAATYADDNRAFDYQRAEPKVIAATIADDKLLRISAHGQNFRGITIDAVKAALIGDGHSTEMVERAINQFADSIQGAGDKISTDRLAMIADDLGYNIVDVLGVKDTYMGGGPNATVRMVFDPSLIRVERA